MFTAILAMIAFADGRILKYEDALALAEKQNKPMVVLVGAAYCAPCQEVKKLIVRVNPADAIVCYVDSAERPELAKRLMQGETIPQTIVYYRKDKEWKSVRSIGLIAKERLVEMIVRARDKTAIGRK